MDDFLSQIILQTVPIEDVVKRLRSDYNRSSALITCLFHDHEDSTPSMRVYPKTNTVFCFGCQRGANQISLVAKSEGVSLLEAMNLIKDWFGVEADFKSLSLQDKSNVKRAQEEFSKTFDFYLRTMNKKGIVMTGEDIANLEDIYQIKDLQSLKKLYEEIKARNTMLQM